MTRNYLAERSQETGAVGEVAAANALRGGVAIFCRVFIC